MNRGQRGPVLARPARHPCSNRPGFFSNSIFITDYYLFTDNSDSRYNTISFRSNDKFPISISTVYLYQPFFFNSCPKPCFISRAKFCERKETSRVVSWETKRERKRGEWITRGSATLIGGRVVFPGAASRTPDWYTKVLTVLSELDAAPASPRPDGQARRHHKVDGRADGGELELAPHLVHLAHGPGRARVQSGANGRRCGGGTGQFRLPELRGSGRKEEPSEDPRHGAPHQQGVHVRSLSLSAWTGSFVSSLSLSLSLPPFLFPPLLFWKKYSILKFSN